MSTSLPHGLDEHRQSNGPDIFAGELQRVVAHPGTGLDALRDFGRAAHGQFHRRYPSAGHGNRKQGAIGRGMQVQRPCRLVCGTIAVVLGVIVRARCRGLRNVSRRCRMPRFLYPSDAPLDPALVFLAQFGLADLEDLARANPELANLLCHHRRHVHHPIAFERVHDLFAIASFDAFSVVPAEGYLDWGVGVESQNSIRHFVLLVPLPGVPVLSLLLQVHRLPRVAVLLPVPLPARRRRIRTGRMSRSKRAFHTELFYADATLDTMVVARPENRERVLEDAVRRFVNRRGLANSTRQSSASPIAPQRAHRYSSWVSSSSLTR